MFMHSQGPFSAGLGSSVVPGDVPWFGPNNIIVLGFTDATPDPIAFQTTTEFLVGSNYPFAIPPQATPVGILLEIYELNSVVPSIIDNAVGMIKAGVPVGTVFFGSVWPAPPGAYRSFGGSGNLMGTTWTPTEINDPLFGGYVKAENLDPIKPRQASVKDIRITVYYTMPAEGVLFSNEVRG